MFAKCRIDVVEDDRADLTWILHYAAVCNSTSVTGAGKMKMIN